MRKRHNELLAWIKTASEQQIGLTGTSLGYLRQIGYGNKQASPEMAARLERVSDGLVTRKQLRPDDWAVIWPELAAA